MITLSLRQIVSLVRAGFRPSTRRNEEWTDAEASGRDFPLWRALKLAQGDAPGDAGALRPETETTK